MEKNGEDLNMTKMEVHRRVGTSRTIVDTIVKRKENWIVHVTRSNTLVMEGRMLGKRGLARQCMGMLDEVAERNTY